MLVWVKIWHMQHRNQQVRQQKYFKILNQLYIFNHIFPIFRMSISTVFNQNTLSAIERYALSENKAQYLNSLPDGQQKKIINAITLPYDSQLIKKLTGAGVPGGIARQIYDRKLFEKIQKAKESQQIQDIIDELKKSLLPYFAQSKPIKSSNNISEMQAQGEQGNQNALSSKLNEQNVQNFQEYAVKTFKKNPNQFGNFTDYAIRSLPDEILVNLSIENLQFVLSKPNLVSTFSEELFIKIVLRYIDQHKQRNLYQQQIFPVQFYANLPTFHINILGQKIPELKRQQNYARTWFLSNFQKRLPLLTRPNSKLEFSQKQQKRKILIDVSKQLEKLENSLTKTKMLKQLQLQLLDLDLALQDASLQRFTKFLSTINQKVHFLVPRWHPDPSISSTKILQRLSSYGINLYTFIQNYVTAILTKHSTSQFKQIDNKLLEYIEPNKYRRLKAQVLLAKGEELNDNIIEQHQKLQIREKKLLTICNNNKNLFKVDQEVSLKIKVKNIDKIVVKVYQLNLQKHYIENKTQISAQIPLHFLDPTYQFEYQVDNKNPFREQIYDVRIKEIKNQRGIYIVDLDGADVSSRAIIRKGAVFCLSRVTLAGVVMKFYDDKGKKVQNLRLWFRDQYINVKDSYLIPFGQSDQNISFVAIVDNYAEMLQVKIPRQDYKLQMGYQYNKESFIVGGKSKIILNPRLFLNTSQLQGQNPIGLKLLKNVRVNVQVTDHQYLKSIISFDNVAWSYKQDYVIQIPIQTYVYSVRISGSAEINKYNGTKQTLNFENTIQIFNEDGFRDYYLKKVGDNYIVSVLGLNGQPVRQRVTVHVMRNWVNEINVHELQTDEKGQVNLGPLRFVDKVLIADKGKQWSISSIKGCTTLQKRLCFSEGEKIVIPLPATNHEIQLGRDLNLFYTSQNTNVENLNRHVKINNKSIQIDGLAKGRYSLSIFSLNFTTAIVVVKGQQWQNPNQIYDSETSTVYEFIRNSNHYLNLDDAKVEKEGDNNKVSVRILKPEGAEINDTVKAHVFAYCFIPNRNSPSSITQKNISDVRSERFNSKGNTYLSNKKLSEQASYVLNRKNQKQFVGNNLQKPHILLNRIKVRDTVQRQQQMRGGSSFASRDTRQNFRPQQDILLMDAPMGGYAQPMSSTTCVMPNPMSMQISNHNNFLKRSGFTLENIKSSTIEFTLPGCYSFVTVVLVSDNSYLLRNFNVDNSQIQVKKMSHAGLLKEQKQSQAWSMSRQIYSLPKGQSKKINRTSRWCAVSLYNIIQFAKAQGFTLDEWVQRWGTYSWDTKLQTYNKKACHQLNSYIKHHDEEFFSKVVAPFIRNKINKTFVDLCLLGDKTCEKWAPIQYFDQLNYFQKVLLIQYLAKTGKVKDAQNLCKGLESFQKTKKYSYNTFKQKFQSMLNAQIKPSDPFQNQPYLPSPAQYGYATGAAYVTESSFGGYGAGMLSSSFSNSAPPPPPPPPGGAPMMMKMARAPTANVRLMAMPQHTRAMNFASPASDAFDQQQLMGNRNTYQQQFKQVQKTQQFTEVTYDSIKNPNENNRNFVLQNKFWVDLACYLARGKNNGNFSQQSFITQSILYLSDKRSFTLAASFLPKNLNPDYDISSQGNNIIISVNKPFLLFIKQIKPLPFAQRSGLMINHRFVDESDRYIYEQDGNIIQKEVDQFIKGKQYSLQTLVTNTTANNLEVQLLVDLPEGAISLGTKQYTEITTHNIGAYSTQSFSRRFYFPNEGVFNFYPANASLGKTVIAKASNLPKIQVKVKRENKKLQTFLDVIQQGQISDVVKYLQAKNVFDTKFFRPGEFLWMLKDKSNFEKIIGILRQKGFIDDQVWRFGFLHNDLQSIKQYMSHTQNKNPLNNTQEDALKVFQYYPYYSSRAHKYSNQNKSKIRNVEFKQTYYRFLFEEIAYFKGAQKANFKLATAYFLLLQDRVDEASKIIKTLTKQQRQNYLLQADYLESFLDMYQGFPNFAKARSITQKYAQYPVQNWRNLFLEIQSTLKNYDNAVYVQDQEKKVQFKTNVVNEGDIIRISIPANHRVEVLIYSINLQLIFSENAFKDITLSSSIRPAKSIVFEAGESREQKLKRQQDLKDVIVQVFQSGKSIFLRKVSSFLWTNPKLKAKLNEKKGSLQLFYENKPLSGSYCKVYSTGSKGQKFYRDGYTDITGTFKYALSEISEITKFSILCVSDYGGLVNKVNPPSSFGQLSQL